MVKQWKFVVISFLLVILSACEIQAGPETSQASDTYLVTGKSPQTQFNIIISETTMQLNGETIERYEYRDAQGATYLAGQPLIMESGQEITLHVENKTREVTNIHWHGLIVPNDQDGPDIQIEPGATYTYHYTAPNPGTYWYHSHNRPVRDQVDGGMYGPLVIVDPIDVNYDRDQIFVLDDWVVNENLGTMEIIGDVDTLNGLTGEAIPPVNVKSGELHKWRFINASTAKTQYLRFPVPVRITHTDGQAVVVSEMVEKLTLYPGERYDVEFQVVSTTDQTLSITNERKNGLEIPLAVSGSQAVASSSPFVPTPKTLLSETDATRTPDFTFELTASMGMMAGDMQWLINGDAYPDTPMIPINVGQTYKIRYENSGMHQMVHPMHIHGAHFRVITRNDEPVDELWKDTVGVPAGGSVEILATFTNPGMWMLHCHILDHEDAGMMLMFDVKE